MAEYDVLYNAVSRLHSQPSKQVSGKLTFFGVMAKYITSHLSHCYSEDRHCSSMSDKQYLTRRSLCTLAIAIAKCWNTTAESYFILGRFQYFWRERTHLIHHERKTSDEKWSFMTIAGSLTVKAQEHATSSVGGGGSILLASACQKQIIEE